MSIDQQWCARPQRGSVSVEASVPVLECCVQRCTLRPAGRRRQREHTGDHADALTLSLTLDQALTG
jgi:hypothetical protein